MAIPHRAAKSIFIKTEIIFMSYHKHTTYLIVYNNTQACTHSTKSHWAIINNVWYSLCYIKKLLKKFLSRSRLILLFLFLSCSFLCFSFLRDFLSCFFWRYWCLTVSNDMLNLLFSICTQCLSGIFFSVREFSNNWNGNIE